MPTSPRDAAVGNTKTKLDGARAWCVVPGVGLFGLGRTA